MEVVTSKQFKGVNTGGVAVALGSFDGLHLGHQAVIENMQQDARTMEAKSAIFTFTPHPLEIIRPELAPTSLISDRQKKELAGSLGLDYYFEQYFDKEFAHLDYQDFVREILVKELNIVAVVTGEDFRFGYHGKGNIRTLTELGDELGFKVTGINTVRKGSRRISSTLIRKLIKEGKIKEVPAFLGRNYTLEGKVVSGEGRGNKLGFPTANLELDTNYTLPPNGVYANYVYHRGKKYRGISNFGLKPTFSGQNYSIEIHIIDFKGDLYGEQLEVEMIDFIRPEMNFKNSTELTTQIRKDILYTDTLLCYN